MQRNDRELTSNAEVRASSGSGDVVGAATKRNSPHGLVFDLVCPEIECYMIHCVVYDTPS